jgi:3-hydroxyethyl bacteriochlorophyllide a dehydrogenase
VKATAVLIQQPKQIEIAQLPIDGLTDGDIAVEIIYSGISTGTEKLLWSGKMPNFPGMGYPLVPGYESVGRIIETTKSTNYSIGDTVFVPGAKCFGDIKGLFGGASSHVVLPQNRVTPLQEEMGSYGVLLALAATAYHVTQGRPESQPGFNYWSWCLG